MAFKVAARKMYDYISFHVHRYAKMRIKTEARRLGISEQTFVRGLIQDYFIREHGENIITNSRFADQEGLLLSEKRLIKAQGKKIKEGDK